MTNVRQIFSNLTCLTGLLAVCYPINFLETVNGYRNASHRRFGVNPPVRGTARVTYLGWYTLQPFVVKHASVGGEPFTYSILVRLTSGFFDDG